MSLFRLDALMIFPHLLTTRLQDRANQELAASLRAAEEAGQTLPAVVAHSPVGSITVTNVNNSSGPPQQLNGSLQHLNGSEDSSPSPTHSSGSGQTNGGGGGGHDGVSDQQSSDDIEIVPEGRSDSPTFSYSAESSIESGLTSPEDPVGGEWVVLDAASRRSSKQHE